MRTPFLIVVMLFGVVSKANCQQFIERIYLKDSTYYEGFIIEQVPQQYLRIDRIKLKDTVLVPMNLVWKLTKSYYKDSTSTNIEKSKFSKKKYLKVVFLELVGNTGLYSLNMDMRTEKDRRDRWGYRVGFEQFFFKAMNDETSEKVNVSLTGLPFGINYLFGKKEAFFEIGIGATYMAFVTKGKLLNNTEIMKYRSEFIKRSPSGFIGTLNIGYRHVPLKSGFMYHIVFAPLLLDALQLNQNIIRYIGLGLGYKF